jgi:hypothetical protein
LWSGFVGSSNSVLGGAFPGHDLRVTLDSNSAVRTFRGSKNAKQHPLRTDRAPQIPERPSARRRKAHRLPANGGDKTHEHGAAVSPFGPYPEGALDSTPIATAPKARQDPLPEDALVPPHGVAMFGVWKNAWIGRPASVGGMERSSPGPQKALLLTKQMQPPAAESFGPPAD